MPYKYQLANGMNVILAQSKKSPVVSAQVWVRNGSADEQSGEEGLSHFIEHLVFKGTDKFEVGEIANEVESAGGQLNAYTSFDQTVYYMTLSKEYREKALEMLSEMVGKPRFDKDEVDNEREVVIEEIKRGKDSPGRVASRMMFENTFKKHPYKKPVIGYESVVKKVSVKKLKAFFDERYSTKNMFLLLVGDFEKKDAKKEIETYFGPLKAHKLVRRVRPKEDKQLKPRIKVLQNEFDNTYCYISWPAPNVKHKDVPALDLLSMVMGYGESSLLSNELRNKLGVVNSVGASTYTPQDKGLFMLSAVCRPENLESYLSSLLTVIDEKAEQLFSNKEMHKAIIALENHEFFAMETVDGLASKYGSNELLFGDPEIFKEHMKQIRSLEPADLLRVFKKYLKPELVNLSVSTNRDGGEVKKLLKGFLKSYASTFDIVKKIKPEKRKASGRLPKLGKPSAVFKAVKTELAKDVTLVSLPNFQSGTISLQIAMEGGSRKETEELQGLYSLLSDCILSGTKSMSEEELNSHLESKAIYLSSFSGRNSYGLKLSCLGHVFEEGLELLNEMLFSPKMEEAAIEREKMMSLDYLKSQKDRPSQVAFQNMMVKFFKYHPYSFESMGTEATIPKLTRKMCIDAHQENLKTSKIVISCVGAIEPDKLIKHFKKSFSKRERKPQLAFPHFNISLPKKDLITRKKLPKEQSHIFLAYPGLSLFDERRYIAKVMESILSGQGGRLFIELRDKASLAYTVSPMRMEGVETGYFGCYIGCSPEKEARATKMMKIELQKLVDELVSEEELAKAKQNLIGRFDIQMQRNSSIASKMLFDELYGHGFDEKDHNTEKVQKVTREQIQELAKELFTKPSVLSVVEGKL